MYRSLVVTFIVDPKACIRNMHMDSLTFREILRLFVTLVAFGGENFFHPKPTAIQHVSRSAVGYRFNFRLSIYLPNLSAALPGRVPIYHLQAVFVLFNARAQ